MLCLCEAKVVLFNKVLNPFETFHLIRFSSGRGWFVQWASLKHVHKHLLKFSRFLENLLTFFLIQQQQQKKPGPIQFNTNWNLVVDD